MQIEHSQCTKCCLCKNIIDHEPNLVGINSKIKFQMFSLTSRRPCLCPSEGGVDKTWAQAHGLPYGPPYGLPPNYDDFKILIINNNIDNNIILIFIIILLLLLY